MKNKLKNKFVMLLRKTTWRCGKIERNVIRRLSTHRQQSVVELMKQFPESEHSELVDALGRLERRQIIQVTPK